ncbi:TetR/AcrR family transcriptional regulator [Schumannella soli]|uniref:TetR/AcrR family transcriptional regulator n=1 Tax=Schumannella soli TaxID=2590779 RepID=A0A506Y6D8_9MICO|nr:TetR/AcrR family transcriptional regulator [Schumannella soli]TPW77433.1 TetR/AcrR family transcriptional regulator [Schumannella soli]
MPTPPKTGIDQVVAAARALLESGGPDAVTMSAVAERVGVRSPSLYKHVRDRRALLAAVVAATVDELNDRVESAADPDDAARSIRRQLDALRAFALAQPQGYGLVFGVTEGVPRPTPGDLERSLAPLLAATTALVGTAHALDAARFLTAWANGYLTMRLSDSLQMGGDLDAAWDWGVERAVAAVSANA